MACRSFERGFQAYQGLLLEFPDAKIELCPVDVSDLHNVDGFCDWLESKTDRIDGLVHNAGALLDEYRETEPGHEVTRDACSRPVLHDASPQETAKRFGFGQVVFVSSGTCTPKG